MSDDGEISPTRVVIGLSFGNSYSSIACTVDDQVVVIANEEGDRQIPSILSYVEGEEFHGTQAKQQLVRNPNNTVAGFRDYLGKSFDSIDPTPSQHSARPEQHQSTTAFTIVDHPDSSSTPSTVTTSEITARHLRRLKQSASDYIGQSVTAAVITVPTDFSTAQKEALTVAAKSAELEILQIINEPIAALLAYDVRNVDKPTDKITLVADLGGTRSDVAIVAIRGGMYSILATAHDYSLGGAQLDAVLIEHFAKEFQKKNKVDPRQNVRGMAKMRLEAEACKKALSLGSSAGFNIESLADGLDFSSTVNRSRFEMLAIKVFAAFTRLIETAISKAGLDPIDIDEVLLVGGTAHTPRIASNVASRFPATTNVVAPATSSTAPNPSELIVRGAALQAASIESFDTEDIEQNTHPAVTVTPHISKAVGFVVEPGTNDSEDGFRCLILAETPLPVRRTLTFVNSKQAAAEGKEEDGILVRLCEAEREIKVREPEKKPAGGKEANGDNEDGDDEDEDDDSDEGDDEEETREKVWKVTNTLGELVLQDVKVGARVTLQVNINADREVSVSVMEVGRGKTGVRGVIPSPENVNGVLPNGTAH